MISRPSFSAGALASAVLCVGRSSQIPGEEAYPAYLDSSIKGVYERAGLLRANDGSVGSLTLIGTVSPAGGNFEEPVTLATVKAYLGLSAERAYKRFYPAVDPIRSKYTSHSLGWLKFQRVICNGRWKGACRPP